MTQNHIIFKFSRQSCEQSMNCDGCHEHCKLDRQKEGKIVVHNQDVITYDKRLDPKPDVYYEMFSTYEDSLMSPSQNILPGDHGISVQQFDTLEEVRHETSCYACGGASFIVYKVTGLLRTPICTNVWKGFPNDGWLVYSGSDDED